MCVVSCMQAYRQGMLMQELHTHLQGAVAIALLRHASPQKLQADSTNLRRCNAFAGYAPLPGNVQVDDGTLSVDHGAGCLGRIRNSTSITLARGACLRAYAAHY